MADEVQVTGTLQIKKNNVDWRNTPTQFKSTLTGSGKGPTPGAITATVAGNNVDLTELTTPGFCFIYNMGSHVVHYGLHDGSNFLPLGQVRPGKFSIIEFSSLFGDVLETTGTGDAGNCSFRVLAEDVDTDVFVGAFEA